LTKEDANQIVKNNNPLIYDGTAVARALNIFAKRPTIPDDYLMPFELIHYKDEFQVEVQYQPFRKIIPNPPKDPRDRIFN